MGRFEEELRAEVELLYRGLEHLSYYEFLDVSRSTDYVAIREAFYARAQRFHPDRYVASDDQGLKDKVYALFKRMTEAYNALSDPELRGNYDRCLAGGEARLPISARSRRLTMEERKLNNPFARIYLRAARHKLGEGDLGGAWLDVELALSLEECPTLRTLHAEIVRKVAGSKM